MIRPLYTPFYCDLLAILRVHGLGAFYDRFGPQRCGEVLRILLGEDTRWGQA